MAHDYSLTHRAEFSDTDAAGLVHFTAFFRWMEQTEHAFYRSLGGKAYQRTSEGEFGVPRVHASCDFLKPVSYGEELEVILTVREKGSRKLSYSAEFRSPPGGDTVARGSMTVVAAFRPADGGPYRSVTLPAPLEDGIDAAG
ncbi:MAG: acyl-CoA thioesterase [Gemmatimonadetes bacterium]|nr:acyl-CoA thioesterase [Gemmatimonadota bacterium]